jgi:hypothetical protein
MCYSIRFMEMKEDAPRQLKFNVEAAAYNMVNNHLLHHRTYKTEETTFQLSLLPEHILPNHVQARSNR